MADLTEIETLYKDWLTICAEGDADIAGEDDLARYQALQDRIIGMEPMSPRDLAIQHYVDTDCDASGHSEGFLEKIRKLVEGEAQP